MPKFSKTDPGTLPHLKWSSFQQLITEEQCKGFHLMYDKVVGFTHYFYIFHHYMCSVVSRAILKLVYWFGIPNSNLQMLISVDFWCKLLSIFLVAELREWCFELFRMQNSQKFPGFCPWTPLGRASTTPDSPPAQWLSSRYACQKTGTPKKLLDGALISQEHCTN